METSLENTSEKAVGDWLRASGCSSEIFLGEPDSDAI